MKKYKIYFLYLLLLFFISLPSLSQIKEEVRKIDISSKLVLVGERHNVKSNMVFQLSLIEHLVKTNNLKYIVLEHSYSGAFLYNKFLETGDTSLICNDFYFNSSKERRKFWNNLYEFNNSINGKLYLIGLDYDRSYPFVKTLNIILSEIGSDDVQLKSILEDTNLFLESINDPEKTDLELFKSIKNSFNHYFENHTQVFLQNSLGLYFTDLYLIYNNQHFSERDRNTNKNWAENMNSIIKEEKLNTTDSSFLGIFGSAHIAANKHSFANIYYHEEGGIFEKDVNTIIMHYSNIYENESISIENQGIESINKRLLKDLNPYIDRENNFGTIEVSKLNPKPRKNEKHFKYVFLVKNQFLAKKNKFICQ
ncbi:hypothetical protein ABWH96_00115 [Marivirga tractuosa]|uniref:hypothetical protein n=1 Tax=Marivirga tractuosa TaxID=1006 RepID=UPI0035CFEA74